MKYPKHTTEVQQLTVKPGEVVTVWLDRKSDPGMRNAEQVELRVCEDGRLEIFVDTEEVKVRTFEDWEEGES